jgi:hypothetical protein
MIFGRIRGFVETPKESDEASLSVRLANLRA